MARLLSLSGVALLVTTLLLSFTVAHDDSIRVKHGSSIQAAINKAKHGSRIIVEAGYYKEQLVISKDGIELIANKGVVLLPPGTLTQNGCTDLAGLGTQAGICIIGQNVVLADFIQEHRKVLSVGAYVNNVKVEGFEVDGFGLNIVIMGAKDAEVRNNTVYDGAAYGILTVGSKSSLVTSNRVRSADLKFIGICMDDMSDVHVTQNVVSDYYTGLCVQTNGADVGYNRVNNTCVGVYVDPGVDGAQVMYNHVGSTNPLCKPFGGGGIGLYGAKNAQVQHNDVSGITDFGNANQKAFGIGVLDDSGHVGSGNHIAYNNVTGNDVDLLIVASGKNEVAHNKCATSIPKGLCRR